VAVIEKNSYVGGRTKIFQADDGMRYPMGAVSANLPKLLDNLLEKFNIPKKVKSAQRKYYRGTDFVHWNALSIKVVVQFLKYKKVRRSFASFIDRAEPFLSAYPTELNKPMELWLEENGMPDLKPLFWPYMTSLGYGHIRDVPAIYALKYIAGKASPLFFISFRVRLRPVLFQDLFKAMAAELKGNVYLNSDITSVTYETDSDMINFLHNESNITMRCGSIIIAFAPTPSAMVNLIPPALEDSVSPLLEQIQTIRYYTLLLDDSNGDMSNGRALFFHTPLPVIPDDPAVNVLYLKPQDRVDSHVVAYYLTPSEKSDEQAKNECMLHYNHLFKKNVEAAYNFNRWDYFPHLSTASLNQGFFKTFDSLQGQYHQYYTGSLFTFDMVEHSMAEGQNIIEKYF